MPPFGKFELLTTLAYGGMAELFIAKQRGMANVERLVVVKRILPHLADQPQFVDMFLEEARIAALLDHPNIVPIYDLGHVEGSFFIAMPYVSGINVRTMLEQAERAKAQIPVEVGCAIILQVLAGLDYAHRRTRLDGTPLNIVHRDVSPSNIMVEESGRVLLLDFGIAKAADKVKRETETGSIKGKLTYMSPEQCRADPMDQRSDLFSLGVVFHELATGRRLFKRRTDMLIYRAIIDDPIPDPHEQRPALPAPVAGVILRALEREAANRFASAGEMRAALVAAMGQASLPDGGAPLLADYLGQHFGAELERQRKKVIDAREHDLPVSIDAADETKTTAPPGVVTGRGAPRQEERPRSRRIMLLAAALMTIAAGIVLYLALSPRRLGGPALRLGVVPYLPTKVLESEMRPLADYLERALDRRVEVIVPESYARTVDLLLAGELDLADLPPYPYLLARRRNPGVRLLAMIEAAGAESYEAYLVVRRDEAGVNKIADLAGKRVCYVDRTSTSGYLVPRMMARKRGHDPDKLFGAKQFSGNHYQAMRDLLADRCDVAAVYSGAYLTAAAQGIAVGRTRILAVSGRLPYDSICSSPSLPKDVAGAVRRALLKLDVLKELGRPSLGESLQINGFVPPHASDLKELERELRN